MLIIPVLITGMLNGLGRLAEVAAGDVSLKVSILFGGLKLWGKL